MRILMLNPPFLPKFSRSSRSPAVSKGGTLYYPIWLAYTTGVVEREGHKVKLVDSPAENLTVAEVVKIAKKFRAGLVVIDASTPTINVDVKIAEEIKKETNAFTLLVGPHVSALPKETLKLSKKLDAVARHEYDYIVRDLAEELEKRKPNLAKVRGITYRKGNRILHNKDMPLIENLDELPFVSEVYLKHLNYKNYFYAANLWPEVTILSGRGCPYRCTFCVWPQTMTGHNYRKRSIENIADEFEFIIQNFKDVKEIFIEDDTFTADRERVRRFSRELVKRKIKISWSANSRADVDYKTLKEMKKANCRLLCVGFESANQKILNNIRKGITVEQIKKFMRAAKKAGILVHGCFMIGNQGETIDTIKETIKLAKELEPDTVQFFPIMVYPGTEAYEFFRRKGYLITNNFAEWLDSEGMHRTIVSRPWLSNEELVAWCDIARREFYLRPKYIAKKLLQAVTKPSEAIRIFKAAKTFLKHLNRAGYGYKYCSSGI
ncbi:MAG: radical SAM protein [Candidatus Diapherotrites archaeon]|nr:radical SAM protein [Candidatus Diapherotrites archaeon]